MMILKFPERQTLDDLSLWNHEVPGRRTRGGWRYGHTDTRVSGPVPTSAKYYKISDEKGWQEVSFGSNDGDNTITLTLTDGDPLTDEDGVANKTIIDPGALAVSDTTTPSAVVSSGGGGGCFIESLAGQPYLRTGCMVLGLAFFCLPLGFAIFRKQPRN